MPIIKKEGSNLVVETPLPNIKPEQINVSVQDNVLTIKGESHQQREIDEQNFHRQEMRSSAFLKSVALPVEVLGDKAEVKYKNGFLKVIMPLAIK